MKNQTGSTHLALVVMIATGVAIASITTLGLLETSQSTSADFLQKKRSLFAAEGGIRIVQKLAQNYLSDSLAPNSAEMREYVSAQTENLDLGGFQLEDLDMVMVNAGETVVPSGPFAGMHAEVNTVDFNLTAKTADDKVSSTVSQRSVLGMIKLFQFFLFSDTYTEWNNGPPQTVTGRVHVNNDFCFGGSSGYLTLETVTSAGRAMLMSNSRCRSRAGTARAQISNGNTHLVMKPNGDSGCTNCDNSGKGWKPYALSRWNNHVLDVAHDVPYLRLPGMGTETPAQRGRDNVGNVVSNNGSMRILVDPVLPNEPQDRRAAKFAHQADIRIVNGVWYLRDNANGTWPGIPIWSDHPGNFTTVNEEGIEGVQNVGQSQLRADRTWGASTPQFFSHYEYDETNRRLTVDGNGVISYGNLARDPNGGDPRWYPGQWTTNTATTNSNMYPLCGATLSCTNCPDGIMRADRAADAMTCTGGTNLHGSVGLLNGSRGGFLNGHAQGATFGSRGLAHVYPVNFDVNQFQQALQQVGPGELGSYFQPGGLIGRPFNGIIYVTSTWQNSLRGIDGTNTAAYWPVQGNIPALPADYDQPAASSHTPRRNQNALPFTLCSSSLAGQDYDGAGGGFQIPDCSRYSYQFGAAQFAARINALRLHNGANLNRDVFPKGLTIASNLPVYVLGSYNTNSDVSSAAATDWIPALVTGDFVSHLSNNWNDQLSRWSSVQTGTNPAYQHRPAASTTYNHSVLAGYTVRAENGAGEASAAGINTFLRYNEDWAGRDHMVNGSLVVGFTSVYFNFPNDCCDNRTYQAPERDWRYDPHLNSFNKQPPGTPFFSVYAVEDWHTGE
jgi:hypothetical protein